MLNRKSALIGLISCFYFHSVFLTSFVAASSSDPLLGSARVVFQTNYGDIELGFYPTVAPKTVEHIFKLVRLGGYNTNHIFRVEKGFVAQVADVASGRSAPMNEEQRREAEKTVVGEFSAVKHVRGILSMGRYEDPNSAGSSFSMLLGDSPHLDGKYAIFGKVTKGDETLRALEELPTHREGIFVMPTERITILSTYYYGAAVGFLKSLRPKAEPCTSLKFSVSLLFSLLIHVCHVMTGPVFVALEILMITFKSVGFSLCLWLDWVTFRHHDGAL